MLCVETADLGYAYRKGDPILDSLSLQIPEGSIYGFLGPNGAGKTTTLRLVLGLIEKQKGEIAIFGKPLGSDRRDILRNVGALIESPSLYDHLTATENLAVLQKIYRRSSARIREVLDLVGLGGAGAKKVSQFSLGMKQRLAIAVALFHEPRLLILDEPTNGLDPNGIIEIRALLKTLNSVHGISIVISSHLLAEIEKLVTHLGIISAGRLVFQGTLDALKQRNSASVSFFTSRGDFQRRGISETEIAQMNRELVSEGIDVYGIENRREDLEEIFMDLIGSKSDGLRT